MIKTNIEKNFETNKFIAEVCGWSSIRCDYHRRYMLGDNPKTGILDHIPLFSESLDAMHEAEKILSENLSYIQKHAYNNYMSNLSNKCVHSFHAIAASAELRATTFVETIKQLNLK